MKNQSGDTLRQQEKKNQYPELVTTGNDLPVAAHRPADLNTLLDLSVRRYGENPAIGMAFEKPLSYVELHQRVLVLAAALRDLGVVPGSRVIMLAENSHNWGTVYLAVVRTGGVVVPILPDLPEADVHHILGEMGSQVVFTTQRQLEKLYELSSKPETIITLDDFVGDKTGLISVQRFRDFLAEARTTHQDAASRGELLFPVIQSSDLASILYTSGTSGFSKAVMLSHGNLCANAYSTGEIIVLEPGSVFLSVLPISHTYEFTVGFLLPLIKGCQIVYAGKAPTPALLQKICARERPHAMLVVPLILEKIYKKRVLPAVEKSRMLTLLCRFNVGRKIVYRKIGGRLLAFFGGRLKVMGIGGAALNPEVERFLRDAGFPYLVGYGLTESSPLIAAGPHGATTITLGSTGKPIPGVDVKIDAPASKSGIGEIMARGPNIMLGYWNDPEATAETTTSDGWLRTGDLGCLDSLGNLHIKGRSKSVIVLANGENIYPEAMEHKLNRYPIVVESLVIDNRGMLEAWIYPDYEFIDAQTEGQSRQQRHSYIVNMFEEMRREVNRQLPAVSRLSRIVERREPFIKTATHKIKRYLYTAETMPT